MRKGKVYDRKRVKGQLYLHIAVRDSYSLYRTAPILSRAVERAVERVFAELFEVVLAGEGQTGPSEQLGEGGS